jgi:YggT family protein
MLFLPNRQVNMFVIGNLLKALAVILHYALTLYLWVVVARAVLSWVKPDPYNPIVRFLANVTEPVLYPIRRKLPISFGGIDFSSMLLILAIIFLDNFLVPTLMRMAYAIGV